MRSSAVAFDSSLVSKERLIINKKVVEDIFDTIQDNTKNKKLRGNKNSYIGWIEEKNYSDVLFLYDKKAYGVGWFLYYIQKMPATRIPAIKKQEDFVSLLKFSGSKGSIRVRACVRENVTIRATLDCELQSNKRYSAKQCDAMIF